MITKQISSNAGQNTLNFAADEWISYIRMLHLSSPVPEGFRLVCRLCAEQNPRIDTYYYMVSSEEAVFEGSNPRSVLLGVYAYLRQIGFVFHHPGKDGVSVPEIHDFDALLCSPCRKTADFIHRGVCIEGADSLENVLDFIDWLPKNGYNSFFLQFKRPDTFFERWYNHVFNPTLPPEHPGRRELDDMARKATEAMTLRGILDHRVGHGWTAGALGCEATGWDSEKNQLSPEMLELAAEIDGQRQLFHGIPTNTNLCYSNPLARKRLIDQVVQYADTHRSVNYLHFWLADMANNLCECENCRSSTLSDQYVSILNELDLALTEAGLPTRIVFLLYQELLYPPLTERIQNPERFCLMFAPISRTFEKSYPTIQKPMDIPPYERNHFRFPESVEENLSHYFNWKKIFDGDCFFYDYPLGRAHYGDFGYMKIARVIYDDIHSLKALGSDGYMSCQELRAMTPSSFPNFVMGQALLDVSLSYDELKKTYFESVFGKSWEVVVMYLEQLSELSDTDYFNGHGPRKQPEKRKQFASIAETAMAFLMDLEELRDKDPKFSRGWEFLKFHGRYCILLSAALCELCDGNQAGADRRFSEFKDYIQNNELLWQPWLDVYRVIEVATGYTGFTRN